VPQLMVRSSAARSAVYRDLAHDAGEWGFRYAAARLLNQRKEGAARLLNRRSESGGGATQSEHGPVVECRAQRGVSRPRAQARLAGSGTPVLCTSPSSDGGERERYSG